MQATPDKQMRMYEDRFLSQHFDELLADEYMESKDTMNSLKGPIPTEMHFSQAQEPVAVGVCAHLNADNVAKGSHRAHHEAIARARAREGPSLIVVETYRLEGHVIGGDFSYRPQGELEEQRADDPISKMRKTLLAEGVATEADLETLEANCKNRADAAIGFACNNEYATPELASDQTFTAV